MSAYAEITQRADAGGPETLALLRQLGNQVTRTSSFPPPREHTRWTPEAVDDLLAEMFSVGDRSKVFVITCYLQATDQPSLERLILKTIRNFLIDQAKATERGKLRRRLNNLLSKDIRFVRPPSSGNMWAWALVKHALTLWQGDIEELHHAANLVRGYQILRWNTAGKTPQQTIVALTAVSYGVIDQARGAVRDEDLARVVERRFALLAPPIFVEMPDGSSNASAAALVADENDLLADLGVQDRAKQLLSTLSPVEQALLPCLGSGLDVRMTATKLGRATTEALSAALAERLRLETSDDEDRDAIVLHMVAISVELAESSRLPQEEPSRLRSPGEESM